MDSNDSDLVDLARNGEADAFQQLVVLHSQRIFATAYRITGNEADADDVVQEAFLRAYRKLHLFDGRSRFSTWLHRITVNCAMDSMRKKHRRNTHEMQETALDERQWIAGEPRPDRVAASNELGRQVQRVLRSLSPTERAAFVLRHFEGYGSKEIGEMLGMRSGAVRNAVFRAVAKLRSALGPVLEECHETRER
ncbi:MAG: sigma-70 family RNA polymerase sigma factor [Acidobacteriota bacterium]